MGSPQEMHINFQHLGTDYNINLVKDEKSEYSVEINGVTYAVLGDKEKLESACKILKSVSLDSITSEKDLIGKLSLRGDISFPQAQKADDVGIEVLHTKNLSPTKKTESIEKLDNESQTQQKGRVIIIGGHSTAGKTTIINAIMKLDPNQNELGIDITPPRSIFEYLQKNHTKFGVSDEDWKHLADVLISRDENYHILDAVDGEFQFRDETSESDRAQAKVTAEKLCDPCKKYRETLPHSSLLVIDKAHELSSSGKNVVMDTVNLDKLNNHKLESNDQIIKVLVYCKLGTLSNRLNERTRKALESGHPEDVRAGIFPLQQYLEVFGPRKVEDTEEDVIDTISRETVEKVIDEQFDAGIQDLKRRNPHQYSQKIQKGSIASEREEEKKKLLEAFGFTDEDPMHKTVQLTPRDMWTMRVDTSQFPSIEETAKNILGI